MTSRGSRAHARGSRPSLACAAALFALGALPACVVLRAPAHPELKTVAQQGDMLALSDALEALIAQGQDTPADRAYAYSVVRTQEPDTAATAYARASITGRLVQDRGLRAANLIADVERYGLRSRALDPDFRDGAATLLLGRLYVMAPTAFLERGDSETGLELLEEITAAYPDEPENHLCLAEAYLTLHDPEPAGPHLCFCLAHRAALRPDAQQLLEGLLEEAGPLPCALPTP
jgi:hypothetical protein